MCSVQVSLVSKKKINFFTIFSFFYPGTVYCGSTALWANIVIRSVYNVEQPADLIRAKKRQNMYRVRTESESTDIRLL
jgi:hypothetical protein